MLLYTAASKMAIVAKASPAIIKKTGKICSTNRVILFLNCILSFFLVIVNVWSKKFEVSPSSWEYSSSSLSYGDSSSSFFSDLFSGDIWLLSCFSSSSPWPILKNTSSRVVIPTPYDPIPN